MSAAAAIVKKVLLKPGMPGFEEYPQIKAVAEPWTGTGHQRTGSAPEVRRDFPGKSR
jgi:hypothetical protein